MDQELGHAADHGFAAAARELGSSEKRARGCVTGKPCLRGSARHTLGAARMAWAFLAVALLGFSVSAPPPVAAQDWPARAVKIVAPVGPGGVTDTLARLTADRLAKLIGKPFVVENRGGGGGAIGTEYAAHAPN